MGRIWAISPGAFVCRVAAAATTWNENLSRYLRENVFIVKQDRGPDHWLAEPPSSNTAFIRPT